MKKAQETNIEILSLLGRITYVESHGHFIANKKDLLKYLDDVFSIEKTKMDLKNSNNQFYIIYVDSLPVGFAKLVINAKHESVSSENNCRLERIYILNDFLHLKLGQQFLDFVIEKAQKLQLDTMWLSVYLKNYRAIRFYERNEFKPVGTLNFNVNGSDYENLVFSKKL